MQAIFHTLGITDIWQLIAATMVFLLLPGPGTFCVLTCAAMGGLRGRWRHCFTSGRRVSPCRAGKGQDSEASANPS